MGLYITGDLHGGLVRLMKEPYCKFNRDDYLIITGDYGLLFTKGEPFKQKMEILKQLPFTVLWVDGNHENFDWLNEYEVVEWNGGKVHIITDNCIHLMRGQIFNLLGKKIFTFGGAVSVDRAIRIEGISWWAAEVQTLGEEMEAWKNLEENDFNVDLIITHSAPNNILYRINPTYQPDTVTNFLYEIDKTVKFNHWYFGHYHDDQDFDDKYHLLWFDCKEVR